MQRSADVFLDCDSSFYIFVFVVAFNFIEMFMFYPSYAIQYIDVGAVW